jgi:hypothetical protein
MEALPWLAGLHRINGTGGENGLYYGL